MCGIYLKRDNVCEFLGKKCVKLLKFVKPFSNKKLHTISFWQLLRKKSVRLWEKIKQIYIYLFKKKKKRSCIST